MKFKRRLSFNLIMAFCFIMTSIVFCGVAFSMQPPRPGEIEELRKNGELESRIEVAKRIGNHKVNDYLLQNAIIKTKRKVLRERGIDQRSIDRSPAILNLKIYPVLGILSCSNIKLIRCSQLLKKRNFVNVVKS